MDTNESLLRAILSTVARTAFTPQQVYRLVTPHGGSERQLAAYNLCDGRTPQADIAKKVKLDKAAMSRALARWVEAGIVVRIGASQLPLHVYPLSSDMVKVAKE